MDQRHNMAGYVAYQVGLRCAAQVVTCLAIGVSHVGLGTLHFFIDRALSLV